MIARRKILGLAIAAGLVQLPGAQAQDDAAQFPSRQVTLVVPFAAGGPTDSIGRLVASKLSEVLGKPVIVENRPGGSTSIASRAVAQASPDGHTLMAVDISHMVSPHIVASYGVDMLRDFRPIGESGRSQLVLIVSPALGVSSVADLVKLARSKPEAVTIGHPGVGTTPHVAAITFMSATGLNSLLVSYRGQAAATTDLLGGQLSALFTAVPLAAGLAKDGKVHALGVTGPRRLSQLPDVPTFEETGIRIPGFEKGSWYGLVAPAKTPDGIVAKLAAALGKVAEDPELRKRLAALGVEPSVGTPQEFQALMESQFAFWGKTLQAAGVKQDQ
jgi:tripartite-type tricarboxylate transporter receptor subunit TctC